MEKTIGMQYGQVILAHHVDAERRRKWELKLKNSCLF